MVSLQDAASDGDRAVDVGARLRRIRQGRRRTLKDVAASAQVSESFLSQFERGKVSASVASLRGVCEALGIGIHELFSPQPDGTRVARAGQQEVIEFGDRARKWLLTPRPMHALEVVICEFEPGGSTGGGAYTHGDSDEVFVVLEGRVELHVGDVVHLLDAGDSAHYRSSEPHRTVNVGRRAARVLYAVTPPTY